MTHYLITGGAGFIGSHLADALIKQGDEVTIIDDLSTGRFENIQHLVDNPRFNFAIDTITNEVVLDRLASMCDVIFHLAAAVGVRLIVENPVHTIETNIMGTEAVLKVAQRYRAKVLLASTSEVYGKGNRIPFRENDDVLLGATIYNRWAYAASKMIDEFLGLAYYQEKGLPIVIFRLFNTVGPRQTGQYGMVIPRFVNQALNNEPISVYGDGKQQRSFTWVGDVVDALISLSGNSGAIGQVFNIGHLKEISIYELAVLVKELCKSSSEIDFISYEDAYADAGNFEDMQRRLPDISKLNELIGYQPTLDLKEILKRIIDYHNPN
ncbi:MAG: GDP-mannose 4,6-dehydratase [Anaerolineales bacterium]|nr:GDP-mannose 4,6-dehydratase [Chloroflexota bacterium]MBL6980987.1 GDP-mannose 4,6-dehydratase [Anaerolineales bacterium]